MLPAGSCEMHPGLVSMVVNAGVLCYEVMWRFLLLRDDY